jgi:hypothetical protein
MKRRHDWIAWALYPLAGLFALGLLALLACAPKEERSAWSKSEGCYASVLFENRWRYNLNFYDEYGSSTYLRNLGILQSRVVCFTEAEVANGLRMMVRVGPWRGPAEWRRIEPFYDIRSGGDWVLTIEQHAMFAYNWNVR